ncbi:MAG TPA: co-chaperone DjlA [Steroidobacteraceae bacterium]|nr:co-chaperone DjlA [Steroidobacteraceae bacterium]
MDYHVRMAQWTGKVVGGVLGMLALGPFGAAVGAFLGHQFDAGTQERPRPRARIGTANIGEVFFRTTFQVMGHVAKADGRVTEREIRAARGVMAELGLSGEQVRAAIACFSEGKNPDYTFDAHLAQLAQACTGRPELLRVFVEIQMRAALAGNGLDRSARALMQRMARRLSIPAVELAHIEAVLRMRRGAGSDRPSEEQRLSEAYRVLETEPAAADEEIVKAYRRQLSRHHPDKLKANGLPDSMIEHAKQRTQQIIEAWELVRVQRGIRT